MTDDDWSEETERDLESKLEGLEQLPDEQVKHAPADLLLLTAEAAEQAQQAAAAARVAANRLKQELVAAQSTNERLQTENLRLQADVTAIRNDCEKMRGEISDLKQWPLGVKLAFGIATIAAAVAWFVVGGYIEQSKQLQKDVSEIKEWRAGADKEWGLQKQLWELRAWQSIRDAERAAVHQSLPEDQGKPTKPSP